MDAAQAAEAVKASRPRYRSHGAKSDASDAYLLADLLRTDGHRWRALAAQSDDIRALVRSRDDLVAARLAATNQLSSTLQLFLPGAAAIMASCRELRGGCRAAGRPPAASSLRGKSGR